MTFMKRSRLFFISAAIFFVATLPAYADSLGDTRTFRVSSSHDIRGASTINATLRAVGPRSYMYVDDRYWSLLSTDERAEYQSWVDELTTQFDSHIYPRSVAFWGSEVSPGVDGDPRITILIEQLVKGTGGYFESVHNYPTQQTPKSNGREMVFLSAESLVNRNIAAQFLAHEFQHLISFNQKELQQDVQDDIWLNEARSEYNITVTGYDSPYNESALRRRVQAFARTPSDSLVEWPNQATDYSIASVFIHYLADRYGPTILQSTIHLPARGIRSVEGWLASSGRTERFGDVFADWMAAVIANDQTNPRFGYSAAGIDSLHVVPTDSLRASDHASDELAIELKEWQPSWIKINVEDSSDRLPAANIKISGPEAANDSYFFGGTAIADYEGVSRITSWRAHDGVGMISIPTSDSGFALQSIIIATTHGDPSVTQDDVFPAELISLEASLGEASASVSVPEGLASPLIDGDLIRRAGQAEIYVVWGRYRRYLAPEVLELYGFQSRVVHTVSDEVFFSYQSSNYIRSIDREEVYTVWPDGTKHWMNITPARWDASGRDWGAIFIVNEREAAFYRTGEDVLQ
jgi:hypothetical protein